MTSLVQLTPQGLFCQKGDFYIDPWLPSKNAFITHAHSDHARTGSETYFSSLESLPILHQRLGVEARFKTFEYGEKFKQGDVWVSFHPAGHILGSAQIRIEDKNEVWVVSGDYKRDFDPTCAAFEPVECDTFITEATFGLPIYKWPSIAEVAQEIHTWWSLNKEKKLASVLYCYSLGKSQRVLTELSKLTDQPVYVHGAVENVNRLYRHKGLNFLQTKLVSEETKDKSFAGELILAPPSADGSSWLRRFGAYSTGFASGWMQVRGARRRRSYDKGFIISDHADWQSLIKTVAETKAKTILVTHGNSYPLVRFLNESGVKASPLETPFEGEGDS